MNRINWREFQFLISEESRLCGFMHALSIVAAVLLTATTAFGGEPGGILGTWRTEGDESKVEIFQCGDKLCGKIVWLKNPKYIDRDDGVVGTPIIDKNNPDPALRSRPLIGLTVLAGFTLISDDTWGNGTLYDPRTGKTYEGKIHQASSNRLELRGFVGIPLFGRSSVWNR
jgi:uncharacterized protein (DUF2147 family)